MLELLERDAGALGTLNGTEIPGVALWLDDDRFREPGCLLRPLAAVGRSCCIAISPAMATQNTAADLEGIPERLQMPRRSGDCGKATVRGWSCHGVR